MKSMQDLGGSYMKEVPDRGKKSHVHKEFQEIGLMVAELLCDAPHKALYIKLAKELGKDKILTLAKSVAERREVSNRGAYFMSVLHGEKNGRKFAAYPKKNFGKNAKVRLPRRPLGADSSQ